MSVRNRILLTLVPFLVLLIVLGGAAVILLSRLGGRIDAILRENFDSVIAMERLNEALERIDSSFQFTLAGQVPRARDQYQENWHIFREKLRFEQGNVTVSGEKELVEQLTELTQRYRQQGDAFYARPANDSLRENAYFGRAGLLETFTKIKSVSNQISQINQDNMEETNRQAKRTAAVSRTGLAIGLVAAVLLAALAVWYMARISRDITEHKRVEDALQSAAAYHRRLLEASLDPLVTIGPDGKITDVNAATEAVTGCSRLDLVGNDFADYFTDPESARAGYQRVFSEGEVRDYPLEIRHRDGHVTSVHYNASVYRDEAGNVVGAFAAARDITQRKFAEEKVHRLALLQGIVADLGQRALELLDSPGKLLDETAALVARTLGVEFCNVAELLPGGDELFLRAGVGWKEELVGRATFSSKDSQAGYTVRCDHPVIVEDAAGEIRFVPLPRLLGESSVSSMSVVIRTPEGPYGALGVHTRQKRSFTIDEANFLQAVANVLGMAIERKRGEAQVERLARLQVVVADLGQRALESRSAATVFDDAVSLVAQALGVEYCKVLELLPDGKELLLRSGVGWREGLVGRAKVGAGTDSQAGYTMLSDEPVVVEDLRAEKRFSGPPLLHEHGVVSGMSVIIPTTQGPYGVLGTHTRQRRSFTNDEVNFLQAVAHVLGTAIERQRSEEQLRRTNRALVALSAGNQALIRATDETALLQQICQIAVEKAGYRFCWVGYAEQDAAKTVRPVAHAGVEDGYLKTLDITWAEGPRGHGPVGTCIRMGQPSLVKDIASDPSFAPWRAEAQKRGYASSIAIPLTAESNTLGALAIYATQIDAFSDEEIQLLTELSGDLAFGVMGLRERQARAAAAAALRERERHIRLLLDATAEAICGLDPLGKCTWANPACARLLGFAEPAALLGKQLHDLAHHTRQDGTPLAPDECPIHWGLAHGQPVHGDDETMWRADGTSFPAEYWSHPVRQNGSVIGAVLSFLDVSDRKRAEQEVRTLNAELEQRVVARTAELKAANAQLATARELEIKIGIEIQQTLLFDPLPSEVRGLQVAALTVPSQQIDGDFYYFYQHENEALDVMVADVMGKGVPAALLAAAAKSHFLTSLARLMAAATTDRPPEPRDIVARAHAEMVQHLIGLESFVTLCYLRIDRSRRRLDLVDCGHTGLICRRAVTGRCEIVHGNNLALGMRRDETFDQVSVPLGPGDLILLFSDGVTETRNAAGELFGEQRLIDCVQENGRLGPQETVKAIRRSTIAFSGSESLSDDLTCVAILVAEIQEPLAHHELEIRSDLKELAAARAFVRSACRDVPHAPLDDESLGKLELAVTEACSNIVKHAHHGRTDQAIHLEAEVFPRQVVVRLYHLGDAFDPSKVSPPRLDGTQHSGFGVYLINQSVDDVRYYRDERGRNCVVLVKTRHS